MALLILAKHAHLLNIKVRVETELAERQQQHWTLRRLFGSFIGGGARRSAPSAALPDITKVVDIDLLRAAKVAGNVELGETQEVRECVARCARQWRAHVAERKLAAVEANELLGDSPEARRAVARWARHWRQHVRVRKAAAASAANVWRGKAGLKSALKKSGALVASSAAASTESAGRLGSAGTSTERAGLLLRPTPSSVSSQTNTLGRGVAGITGKRTIDRIDWDGDAPHATAAAAAAESSASATALAATSMSGRARRRHTQPRGSEAVSEGTEKKGVGGWSPDVYSAARRPQQTTTRGNAAQRGAAVAAVPRSADVAAHQRDAQSSDGGPAAIEDPQAHVHRTQRPALPGEDEVVMEAPSLGVDPRVTRSDAPLVSRGEARQQAATDSRAPAPPIAAASASTSKVATLRQRVLEALGEDEDLLEAPSDGGQHAEDPQPAAPVATDVDTAAPAAVPAPPAEGAARAPDSGAAAHAAVPESKQHPIAGVAGPSPWQRVRARVGFESRASGSDDGKQQQIHTTVNSPSPAQSTNALSLSSRVRLCVPGDSQPSQTFTSTTQRLGGSSLLGKMRDVIAAAQADPVVLAQNQFLVLLAHVRSLLRKRTPVGVLRRTSSWLAVRGTSCAHHVHCSNHL